MSFKKSDLQEGDKVTYRDGRVRYFIENAFYSSRSKRTPFNQLHYYDNNLVDNTNSSEFDIVKVERTWEINQTPSIEIDVKINGKSAKLSDISEETLRKIRENE